MHALRHVATVQNLPSPRTPLLQILHLHSDSTATLEERVVNIPAKTLCLSLINALLDSMESLEERFLEVLQPSYIVAVR